jgi:hypothetical protein
LSEAVGFVEGKTTDASTGGMGVVLATPLSPRFLTPGARYVVDVEAGGEPLLRERMTVRHATGESVGLAFDQELPLIAALDRIGESG